MIGLAVNLVSARLLKGDHAHHAHGHHPARDHNLRDAYMHVLADPLTSVLAIVVLVPGRSQGRFWADPMMGAWWARW